MEFRVLGPLEVVHAGGAGAPAGAKERAILARLLLEPGRAVSSDALLEAVWPDRPPEAATRSLHVRLANLRKLLEPGRAPGTPSALLPREGPGYRLAVEPGQVDAGRFARLVREAGSLEARAALAAYEEALGLWRGPPFGEFAFAEFAQLEIRRLEDLHARASEGRAGALVELGRHEEALPELRRLVDAEPTREELGRMFALALYRSGRQVDALEALRALGAELLELGLEPGKETRELERRILVHDPALALSPTATPAPPTRAPRRLPAPASRFFGREAHLAHAGELLEELPLVTIAGVGGAGKTRLALELARRSADRFPDGRWLCELGRVGTDADVPGALTDALGVEPAAGDIGLDRAIEHLAARRGLLVLDNCEHVLDGAAAAVEQLLAGCPDLRILATSRAPVGVEGEQVLRLAGLELPAGRRAPDAVESPAVALFIDRARAAGGPFDPESELGSVAEICRRLDGLPLAIELAAGRARSLTPAEIAAHLGERFSLLAVSGRRAAPRHTTLRAAIDWSYDLLEVGPQRLFERLSVFVRGATLDGARDVCAGDGVEHRDVAALLDQLVAQSMVTATSIGGHTLYGMLESLRDYAAERLENRGEHERLRDRHADHYAARARRVEGQGMRGGALPFADELDDARAAVRWSLRTDADHERAFTIVVPLWALAPARHAEEIALLAEEALERWPQEDLLRLQVLGTASTARLFLGDLEGARRHAEVALALEESVGETALLARRTVAHLALYSGDRGDAARQTQDVAARARAAGEGWLACECDGFTIQLLHAAGDGDAAITRAAEMRREAERLDVPFLVCWSLYVSGVVHLDRDPQGARRWFMDAVALGREVGHHHMVRFSLRGLGVAALLDGDYIEAAQRLLAALAHDEERSDAASQWTTLAAIAPLLAERAPELAVELLAASEAWPAGPMIRGLADRTHERIAECLSAERRAEAIERGQERDLASAKASARSRLDELLREPVESVRP